jgi:hypothetical protein
MMLAAMARSYDGMNDRPSQRGEHAAVSGLLQEAAPFNSLSHNARIAGIAFE